MIISLVGMSNAGKTYWSERLEAEKGFTRFCCDDMIEGKLAPILKKQGFSGIEDVSKWMGQPYDEQYEENSKKYLECEIETMKEIIHLVNGGKKNNKNVVIDTTGSVIYVDSKILSKLCKISKVVHIKTSLSLKKELLKKYLENPKPVLWGRLFNKKNGESDRGALVRCYPKLLDYRLKRYNKYADLSIDYSDALEEKFDVNEFMRLIQ